MYTDSRDEEVKLLKRLWTSQSTVCPKCGGAELVHLHKKAKKSDCDWTCPACGERIDDNMIINVYDENLLSGYNIICNRHDCGAQMANVEFRPE